MVCGNSWTRTALHRGRRSHQRRRVYRDARHLKPDILLLDLRMPVKNGLAVLEMVNFDTVPTRVIVLTAAEDERDVVRAMRLGARGALLNSLPPESCANAYSVCTLVKFGFKNDEAETLLSRGVRL